MERELTVESVADALRRHLAHRIERHDVDVVSDAGGVLDCAADNWTLHLEGLPLAPWGFFALDDEPDDPDEYEGALRRALFLGELDAFAAVDAELNGAVAVALSRSGDPFTLAFLRMLAGREAGGA